MAGEAFSSVDCSKEKHLTIFNWGVSADCEWRLVTEEEIRIHKASRRECLADDAIEDWLQLCELFRKEAWKPPDEDAGPILTIERHCRSSGSEELRSELADTIDYRCGKTFG